MERIQELFEKTSRCNQFSKFVFCDGCGQQHITRLTDDGLITKVIRKIDGNETAIYYKHKRIQ
jgi:hypothetical protein